LTSPRADLPALSVVLPVYNGARFLGAALDSVLAQDFRDFECIAVDDGSTDQSAEILDEYQRRDARLHVFHQSNAGLVDTLNIAIGLCRAPLVARMDADDICLDGRFAMQMSHFRGRDDLAALGGQVQLIDGKGRPIRLVDYPGGGEELAACLEHGSPLAHPAVMFRKAAVERVGSYRKAFSHAEDYDLWLRLHEAGYGIENLKIPLLGYRQHDEKVSLVHRQQQALATLAARCAHRMRIAGLPDPTADLDRLDESLLDRFPAALMAEFESEELAVRLGAISFDKGEKLERVLAVFESLPSNLQCSRSGMRFLLRMGWAALKRHSYLDAASCVRRAVSAAPLNVASVVWQKLLRAFSRSLDAVAK
jgi:Glycosyl transferase family 2